MSTPEIMERVSNQIIGEILAAAGEPPKLISAVLKQALFLVHAERGIAFDHDQIIMAAGLSGEESQAVRKRLSPLLIEGGLRSYPATPAGVGMAGVLVSAAGPLAVLAVERETPFEPKEASWFGEWLRLASAPAGAAVEYARAARRIGRKTLKIRELPLNRLKELPPLELIELMVVNEALRRSRYNKTQAAATLGITREGLRKKILRLAT